MRRLPQELADALRDLDPAGLAQQLHREPAASISRASASASVVLPAPSTPSIVISFPLATRRRYSRIALYDCLSWPPSRQ